MAKETKQVGGPESAVGGNTDSPTAARPKFEVRSKNAKFAGELFGIIFKDGVGETDNPTLAYSLVSAGETVIDRRSGLPYTGLDPTK